MIRDAYRKKMLIPAGIFILITSFLLPLKFSGLSAMSEAAGFFPESISSYLYITFPAHSAGIFSAIALVLTIIALPDVNWKKLCLFTGILWSIVWVAATLPGFYGSGVDPDMAAGEFANAAGIAAWSAALWLLFNSDPRWGRWCTQAFFAGMIITALNGYWQYFAGFEEIRKFVAEEQAKGVVLSEAMRHKLADTRIFSFAASSNALAGLLLSTLPVGCFFAFRWGERFEPQKISRIIFSVSAAAVIVGALILTRSRSVVFCLGFAILLAVFSAPRIAMKWKTAAGALLLLIGIGVIVFAIHFGRGTASMAERADYLRSCAVLTAENPFCGSGWGAFFYRHMEIKLSATDEAARDPHNTIAAFAAQSGIFAALAVTVILLAPLAMLWKERFSGFRGAVFWSGLLFTLHSLMDCDIHIPGQMFFAAMIYAAALAEKLPERSRFPIHPVLFPALLLAVLSFAVNAQWLEGEKALAALTEKIHPSSQLNAARYSGKSVADLMEDAAALRPSSALIPEMAGDWHSNRGDFLSAEKYYRRALELNPRRPGIYIRMANIENLRGARKEAETYLSEAARRFPRKYGKPAHLSLPSR